MYTNTSPYRPPFTATVKDYGGHGKKLTVSKVRTRQSGLCGAFDGLSQKEYQEEVPPDVTASHDAITSHDSVTLTPKESNKSPPDEEESPQRLANNLSRARATIFELALCNNWEYFLTFTLNPHKYDRTDLKKFNKDLSRFIRNYRARQGADVKYLLIPEQHKDGESWHMHGFLMGLPESHLRPFTLEEHIPYYIRRKLESGQLVYEWEPYHKKFGFCDIEPIRNIEATSKYVTKYVTKAFDSNIIEAGGHLYYASQKLNRAATIAKGQLQTDANIVFDFENDYVKTKWFPPDTTPENYIEDDAVTQTIRTLRKERPSIPESKWEPTFDAETGEIFPTPFDNYNNSYHDADVSPPPSPTKAIPEPPTKRRRKKSEADTNQLSLDLDADGFIIINPDEITLPLD